MVITDDNIEPPIQYQCPITYELMTDPVIAEDGHTYERQAIVKWFQTEHKSPLTNLPIGARLVPNVALRQLIEEWIEGGKKEVVTVKLETIDQQQPFDFILKQTRVGEYTHLQITPPTLQKHIPISMVCVVDISGSMDQDASVNKQDESDNLSRLDLVKHCLRTIITMLQDQDELGIVVFSTAAQTIFPLQKMTDNYRKSALEKILNLRSDGSTNIWDGMRQAFSMVRDKLAHILLFTDGEPTIAPPRGIWQTVDQQLTSKNLQVGISTFGFGYQLDSYLLSRIARVGSGMYNYIPDATMIGTVFVNYMASIMTSVYPLVNIESTQPAELFAFEADKPLRVGAIQQGSTRDIIYKCDPDCVFKLNGKQAEMVDSLPSSTNEFFRTQYSLLLYKMAMSKTFEERKEHFDKLVQNSKTYPLYLRDLVSDMPNEGQVGKAIQEQFYEKWGRHYIRALACAHWMQLTSNYLDVGIQHYGSEYFKSVQQKCDDVFCNLPAPVAHHMPKGEKQLPAYPERHMKQAQMAYGAAFMMCEQAPAQINCYGFAPQQQVQRQQPRATMQKFHNRALFSQGCFAADTEVELANGGFVKMCEVAEGMVLKVGGKVELVIRLVEKNFAVVEIGDVLISPYHPVFVNEWKFAKDVSQKQKVVTELYNLVTESGVIEVGKHQLKTVSMGHGLQEEVVKHQFFGNKAAVLNSVSSLTKDEQGRFLVRDVVRGPDGLVSGFI